MTSIRTAAAVGSAPASRDRVPWPAWVIGAVFVAVELAFSGRYGFQQDELYFVVAGRHPAFGYVDQPPLAPLLTRTTGLLGVDPAAIRILPALAGGAVVVIAARTAALFGAGRTGRTLAALATATAPVLVGACHIGNTTPYDLLAWAVVVWCVATAQLRERPRWWLGAGAAAGLGLQNEYLVVLAVGALVVGLLTDPAQRAVPATRWPWAGGALALALWAPNLVWQARHGWPQLAMAGALHAQNTSTGDYLVGLPGQLLYAGVLGVPLAVAGVGRLWRTAELRFLAVAVTLVVLYVLAWVPGKVYYTDGLLPLVLGAGAASAEHWVQRSRGERVVVAVCATLGVLVNVLTLPLVPVASLHRSVQEHTVTDTVGWPQLTAQVVRLDAELRRSGEAPTAVFTGSYAEAGALQLFGGRDRLPPVLSAHNNYWLWGPGTASDRTVLTVDAAARLRPYFADCRRLAVFNPPDQVQNDWNDLPIDVCTGPKAPWTALWPRLRHYD
ncbi:glycosyltransferase family 39 protein [Phaeacidiphilus oryzae]|uniref:glycosyltransferase family 39 protein n=1 Tax=Phaeacidiphilus oryzae TaxID=348818 RepID=UPI00055FD380|nr:glycosyltransferase family 39 protein [Phaeacidiphilus oryzae]